MSLLLRAGSSGLVVATLLLSSPKASALEGAPLCATESSVRAAIECDPALARPTAAYDATGLANDALLPTAFRFVEAGEHGKARIVLREAARRFPRIADHLATLEGEVALREGHPAEARNLFQSALESESPQVRLLARTGMVRAMLETDDERGPAALRDLLEDYPELPGAIELEMTQARAFERRGAKAEAAAIYRRVDLEFPGSELANEARTRIEALRNGGTDVPSYTLDERIARASRLVQTGPTDHAGREVDALLDDAALDEGERRTVLRLAVRVARVEGRFEDVERYEQEIRGEPRASRTPRVTLTPEARRRAALGEFRRLARGRTVARLHPDKMADAARIAADAGLAEELAAVVERAATAELADEVRFAVAMIAAGSASDEGVLRILGRVINAPGELGSAARYHQARTLERLGRLEEAEAAFARAESQDRSRGGYYAMWAEQRAKAVHAELARRTAEGAATAPVATAAPTVTPPATNAASSVDAGVDASTGRRAPAHAHRRGALELATPSTRTSPLPSPSPTSLADRLAPLASTYAEAYPWIGRAEDLLRLGDAERATNELYEVLVAARAASGRATHRAGLEAIARGRSRAEPASRSHDRRRRHTPLATEAKNLLADVAAELGDHGTAIAFDGEHHADDRPRPYEAEVEAAARQYGVDPNLVYAVMRVESVYQPRVVSYAGAIGLLQIMPRTGSLIAHQLGRVDFTTADLLEPRTNIEFGAWYLASLIRRFDGRIPLAIASYNGGPHNVRTWIEENGPSMPLDAFLERIPFDQTHRYVRRVLTHYAAYRAQKGLDMVDLPLTLPRRAEDSVGF
ncbi:MAG: transglycosylase SLT domain-containing protein [Polyangiales bacterium]